jgi:hypothetical protein
VAKTEGQYITRMGERQMFGRISLDKLTPVAYTFAVLRHISLIGVRRVVPGLVIVLALGLLLACKIKTPVPPPPVPLPTATVTPCMARLDVRADPQGARIVLDGLPAGASPAQLHVTPGQHTLELTADGYASYRITVDVTCGEVKAVAPGLYDSAAPVLKLESIPETVGANDGLKVTAASSDNRSVASMALYVDEGLIYRLEGDRLRHNLDTRALESGQHALRVVATDGTGNVQQVTATFVIEPASTPSVVAVAIATAATPPNASSATPAPTVTRPSGTSVPTATPAATSTAAPTAAPAVAVYEGHVTLTMYDYKPALYTDAAAGHPYPLLHHDQVGPPINQTYKTIVLQNEYLEVTILPELGGRIYQCRFLPTGQPLLYNNAVIKPTYWGPADQGWWLAIGGIEFALPVDEHGYLTAQPWDATVARQGDGGATVVLQIQEMTRGLQTRVELTLRPSEAAIRQRTSIRNASGTGQQFQFWTNAMLSPGRYGVGSELRITFPADEVTVHSRGDVGLPAAGSAMSWPLYGGRDLSAYGEWRNWLGFFGPVRWAPFMAVYDPATQIGMVHAATQGVLPGSKIFGMGRDFDTSVYSDDGAQYVEMWSGITPTFWQNATLPAGGTLGWNEVWYVVSQSDGVTFANQQASLYAWRDGDAVRVTVAAPAPHRWRMVAEQNGVVLSDQVFDVWPDTPYRATLASPASAAGSTLNLQILDLDGASVLEYGF